MTNDLLAAAPTSTSPLLSYLPCSVCAGRSVSWGILGMCILRASGWLVEAVRLELGWFQVLLFAERAECILLSRLTAIAHLYTPAAAHLNGRVGVKGWQRDGRVTWAVTSETNCLGPGCYIISTLGACGYWRILLRVERDVEPRTTELGLEPVQAVSYSVLLLAPPLCAGLTALTPPTPTRHQRQSSTT